MSADKLTDEQRRTRALVIDQVNEKIKAEYGDALAALGMLPVVVRVWPYTVEEHVESARRHDQLVNEIINVLTCAEGRMEIRERREAKRDDRPE